MRVGALKNRMRNDVLIHLDKTLELLHHMLHNRRKFYILYLKYLLEGFGHDQIV